MVPNGWKKGVIEDIAKVSSGGTPSRQNNLYWLGGQIPWVTTTEVKFGVINDTEQKITEAGLKNSSAKLFPKDTILMAMYGQGKTRGQVAKLGIEASTNQACAALLLNDGFEVDYYYQYLVSQYENIRELANSGGQQNLSAGIIKSIHVPIPPQLEQRKIAKILSTWDKAISSTERLIDNSKQQKKALMQQLLTGKKRLLDDSGKPFVGEWLFSTFSEVFKVANNKKTQIKSGDYLESGHIPIVDQGKQLISGYTNNVEKYDDIPVIIFGDHTRIVKWVDFEFAQGADGTQVLKATKHFDGKFSYYLLSNTDIPNLGYSRHMRELKEKDFKHPNSIKEQQKIALILTNADNEIGLLEQQLADLKQEKKALMQQLLTGKRRVKVDDKEVA
jgi:type I restriction enzyme S subunit